MNLSNYYNHFRRNTVYGLVAALVLMMVSAPSFAAEAIATVSKNVVRVNEVFQLSISVDESLDRDELDLSPLDNNFNYGTPRVSNSTSMINGAFSRSTEWTLAVAAKAEGDFTIPAFAIGDTETQPIIITALAGKSGANGNSPQSQAADDANVILDTELDKTALYVGESLIYRIRLLIGDRLQDLTLAPPSGKGLDVSQIGDDSQTEKIINGRRYAVIERAYRISALEEGSVTLEGAKFNARAVRGQRGFGASLAMPIERVGETHTLDISGIPAGYQGLWLPTTDLQLSQHWQPDTSSTKVGEPITRTIILQVKDIAQSRLPNIDITYPDSVRVYSEKPLYGDINGYTVMTIKQVIIPKTAGDITLPALSINWWDTVNKKQQTSRAEGMTFDVAPGDSNAGGVTTSPFSAVSTDQDTLNNAPLQPLDAKQDAGFWPWLTGLFAALWLATLFVLWRQNKNIESDQKQPATASGSSNRLDALIQAVENNESLAIQTRYRLWKKEHLPDDLRNGIETEIHALLAATYGRVDGSNTDSQWNNTALLSLLAKAKKVKAADRLEPALSTLVPQHTVAQK